ncbi:MAG: phosphoribosylamine--glycine ligase [Cytophagia bacterium]|nr:MAG: phosphoribosylamine--glycine ligase [Cytophagia bacterium]TAG44530.1 MAG: phosphoribosylamine--glycine ligase [Cytophagia bacterium]TAH30711.1 MAG: phosphoribosylamine--glycine ligase [Cytophagales bacterium]
MKILLLGSGGREHALAWKLTQSKKLTKLYVAPGNAGTSQVAENIDINVNDFQKIEQFIIENAIEMLIVGPEEPLVKGLRNYLQKNKDLEKLIMIAPDENGAKLEGSKDFAKEFMQKNKIPTAQYQTFTAENYTEAIKYIQNHNLPIVLKADGLAAGKGVIIPTDYQTAENTLKMMLLENKFGEASKKVVIEEFLEGIELSMFVLTDGKNYVLLPEAKDYKRIGEGDKGLNTGGMGAISPVPFADNAFIEKVKNQIILPTLEGLKNENIDYQGFIFFGLINVKGNPFVIEYNVRMGDPETEVVIPRIKNDLVEIFEAVGKRKLNEINIEITTQTATTVMLVAGGYPEQYEKGKEMTGFENLENVLAFHAGTTLKNNTILTSGGRVLAVTALGANIKEALEKSNQGANQIQFEGKYFRKDIGFEFLL